MMHAFANLTRFLSLARWLTPVLLVAGVIGAGVAMVWGIWFLPPDRLMGETVRILIVHVPTAWLGMGGWAAMTGASIAFLVWRHPLAALSARAIAVPGLAMTLLCLLTGSIWGRPTWGSWWEWDGRLTSMLVLAFLYAGYLALANAIEREDLSAKLPAIFAIVGAINLPIINRSVVWWNSLHQPASISIGKSAIDPAYLAPLTLAAVAFSMIFGGVVLCLTRVALANTQADARLRRMAVDAA